MVGQQWTADKIKQPIAEPTARFAAFVITFFLVLVKTESILISPLIVFKSILTYGSLENNRD